MKVTISEGGSSATHSAPEAGEQVTNPFKVLALDFQKIILERATGTAGSFELAEQSGQVVLFRRQASNNRNDLALLSLFDVEANRLFLRRSQYLGWRRAGAAFLQFTTPFTTRRSIPLGAFK
jgi:hypothetical protein